MTHGPAPVDVVGPTRRPTRTDRRRAAATALVLAAALCVRETPHPAPPRPMAPADRPDPFAPRYAVHEIRCLARALWFEARGEPPEGRIAVAGVVLARAADPRWPKDLCATIRAPRQFSFVVRGASPQIPDAHDAQAFTDLARAVASGRLKSTRPTALYYHAAYAHPVWRRALAPLGRIGAHLFYADPGKRTGPA